MENFASLGLSDNALDAVARLGYDEPTPVQEQAIPIVLTGRDLIAAASGSLPMMTSVLVSPDGKYEYEAAHGTVPRHYYKYLKGEKTSTNPMATIFAWSGALKKRGELDDLPELVKFGEALEAASLQTLNDGIMTKDLCGLAEGITPTPVDSEGFIKAIRTRLEAKLA